MIPFNEQKPTVQDLVIAGSRFADAIKNASAAGKPIAQASVWRDLLDQTIAKRVEPGGLSRSD